MREDQSSIVPGTGGKPRTTEKDEVLIDDNNTSPKMAVSTNPSQIQRRSVDSEDKGGVQMNSEGMVGGSNHSDGGVTITSDKKRQIVIHKHTVK